MFAIGIIEALFSTRLIIDRAYYHINTPWINRFGSALMSRILYIHAFVDPPEEDCRHVLLQSLRTAAFQMRNLCERSGFGNPSDGMSYEQAACDCMAKMAGEPIFDLFADSKDPGFVSPEKPPEESWLCLAMAAYLGLPFRVTSKDMDITIADSERIWFSESMSVETAKGDSSLVQKPLSFRPDRKDGCAMTYAVAIGQVSLFSFYLSSESPPSIEHIRRCIYKAITEDNVPLLATLIPLAEGAETEQGTYTSLQECLELACLSGSYSTASYLLSTYPHLENLSFMKSKPKRKLNGLLRIASKHGYASLVQLLLSYGADPHHGSIFEEDALSLAASRGHVSVMRLLLEAGVNFRSCFMSGRMALVLAARGGHIDALRLLIKSGLGYEDYDEDAESAMLIACRNGWGCSIRELARWGVPIERAPGWYEKPGKWPMLKALKHGRSNSVKVLLELGATEVDPLETSSAHKFRSGQYPRKEGDYDW